MQAAAQSIPFGPLAAADARLSGGENVLHGWALLETAGAPALVEFFDGHPDTGQSLAPISLTAGQSTRDWLANAGLGVGIELWVRVVAGEVRGSAWVLPAQRVNDVALAAGEVVVPAGRE